MQLRAIFVCLKLRTQNPSPAAFCGPATGLRGGNPPGYFAGRSQAFEEFATKPYKEEIVIKTAKLPSVLFLAVLFLAGMAFAQTDPGVQSGNRGTGATIITSDPNGFLPFFTDGQARFQAVESVSGNAAGNNGLGPRFNSNNCSSCHAQPAIGGTGAAVNPQFAFAGSSVAPKDSRVKPGFHSSSTRTAPPTPAIPMAEWKTYSRLADAAMPEAVVCHNPASLLRRKRTTSSSAFPRQPSARA
jgi:hypothetical protein